jgi:small subunit ribosomal protein S16
VRLVVLANFTCYCHGPGRASIEIVELFDIELESFVIKLRLRRMGAKKRPSYRIVAADSRTKRDGRIIEQIGFYDPLTEPATVTFNEERAAYWLSVGAQPTETVHILLRKQGLVPDDRAERAAAHAKTAPAS